MYKPEREERKSELLSPVRLQRRRARNTARWNIGFVSAHIHSCSSHIYNVGQCYRAVERPEGGLQ